MKTLKFLCSFILVISLFSPLAPALAATSDALYYNTQTLTEKDIERVSGLSPGTVMIVSPDNGKIIVGSEAEKMVTRNKVKIVAIAGLGSSSVGTASFAKHIAKSTGQRVAAIVNGIGDPKAMFEGTQGFFIGRTANVTGVFAPEPAPAKLVELYEKGAKPQKLIAHSKGSLDIANALYKLFGDGNMSMYKNVRVITFGCGVNLPRGIDRIEQYLGTLDGLGISNTLNFQYVNWIVGRYHTTNPVNALTYMPIERYVK